MGEPTSERDVIYRLNHFGFEWKFVNEIQHYPSLEYSESYFECQDSFYGGSYFIYHIDSGIHAGEWELMEMGGVGPDVWEKDLDVHGSPLDAMFFARKLYNRELEAMNGAIASATSIGSFLDWLNNKPAEPS